MTDLTEPGVIVEDRDDPDPNPAVVVNAPPTTADDWYVPGRGMLADDNPEYPTDDRVIIVVYQDDLEREYPYYSGRRPIPLSDLHDDDVYYYAFPASRLHATGTIDVPVIQLDDITPAPYHMRSFTRDANQEYIDDIRERGHPHPYPLVRVLDDGFELINGHKRTWAAYVAGIDAIPCHCVYVDRDEAARIWVTCHLEGYTPEQRHEAIRRLPPAVAHDARGEARAE